MSLSTSIHDIKTLVLSFHPVIVIETVEEDRVFSLLHSTALELRMPFFEWSITTGLVRVPGKNIMYGTGELIWEMDLPANVTGSPMTYQMDQKQYIVFAVGGAAIPGTRHYRHN